MCNDWLEGSHDYYVKQDFLTQSESIQLADQQADCNPDPHKSNEIDNEMKNHLSQGLLDYFGYHAFREGQLEIIANVMQGRDVLALLSTGHGKSICYQLPIVMTQGMGLVISPLISLMVDQVTQLRTLGIPSEYYNSMQTAEQQKQVVQNIRCGNVKILYIAPERLSTGFLQILLEAHVNYVVVDEAHCISQWGHDFRPSYTTIWRIRNSLSVPIIALTATAIELTKQDIIHNLCLRDPYIFLGSFNRSNINLQVNEFASNASKESFVYELVRKYNNSPVIIYSNYRKNAERICEALNKQGIKANYYHAAMGDVEKLKSQEEFSAEKCKVIVATSAFGMGINKSNIRLVVHLEPTRDLESYYQEIGRAGRDGLDSKAVLCFTEKDLNRIESHFEDSLGNSNGIQHSTHNLSRYKFSSMNTYINSSSCRRQALLAYFSETLKQSCGNCDNCGKPQYGFDATIPTQKILSTIIRTKFRVDSMRVIRILTGIKDQTNIHLEFDKLSTFGLGTEFKHQGWDNLIQQLINKSYLVPKINDNNKLDILPLGYDFIQNRLQIELNHPDTKRQEFHDDPLTLSLYRLRDQVANEKDISPDNVLSDAIIFAISNQLPTTLNDLLDIDGLTIKKLKYLDIDKKIIKIIHEHT